MATLAQRFWSKVEIGESCWLWKGYVQPNGYGRFGYTSRKHGFAHRLAYELFVGPIPFGRNVLHHCDTPRCVRPDHLFVGTQGDNMQDAKSKGRTRNGSVKGRKHPHGPMNVKLSPKAIEDIRRRYAGGGVFQRELAAEYNVTQACISACTRRKTWAAH